MATAEVLGALAIGGLMGLVGQGSRAAIGLKKLDDANLMKGPNSSDAFIASRLVVSLMIGFIAGIVASIAIGLDKLANVSADNLLVLLGIAAAGYAGTDAIEAFVARIAPASTTSQEAKSETTETKSASTSTNEPQGGAPPPDTKTK